MFCHFLVLLAIFCAYLFLWIINMCWSVLTTMWPAAGFHQEQAFTSLPCDWRPLCCWSALPSVSLWWVMKNCWLLWDSVKHLVKSWPSARHRSHCHLHVLHIMSKILQCNFYRGKNYILPAIETSFSAWVWRQCFSRIIIPLQTPYAWYFWPNRTWQSYVVLVPSYDM